MIRCRVLGARRSLVRTVDELSYFFRRAVLGLTLKFATLFVGATELLAPKGFDEERFLVSREPTREYHHHLVNCPIGLCARTLHHLYVWLINISVTVGLIVITGVK